MPAPTPGYVKNIMRRSLRELIDRSPTKAKINTIWAYFESRCAFCGDSLDRSKKEGHIDHLVSAAQGGWNHVSNRVLSCANCNEKDKLDDPWEEFLDGKVQDPSTRQLRKDKILDWQRLHGASDNKMSKAMAKLLEDAFVEVEELYSRKVDEIRRAVREL